MTRAYSARMPRNEPSTGTRAVTTEFPGGAPVQDAVHFQCKVEVCACGILRVRRPTIRSLFSRSRIHPPPCPEMESPEARSSEAAAQLRLILDSPSIIIFSLDRAYRYTSFNANHAREMKRIWGVEIAEGLDMLEVIGSDGDRAKAKRNFDRAMAGAEFTLVEEYGDDARSRLFYEDRYCPTTTTTGEVVGVTVFVTDITDRMRAAEERVALERTLQEAARLESLEVLAGGLAHDFNNLLVGVLGFADLAAERLPADSEALEPLANVRTAAQRATGLTQQLLAFSGRGHFVNEVLDLRELASEMTDLLRASICKKARLEVIVPDSPVWVEADPAQLRQVVMNLVINASDALESQSGSIRVTVSLGEQAVLEVADSGHGIAPEHLGRVFEPFFSTKAEGRGLGLAATQGVIRGHGGTVDVSSCMGEGTVVRVAVPAWRGEAPEPPAAPERPARSTPSMRVLVADDEPSVRRFARTLLERKGHGVVVVEDGKAAVETLSSDPEHFDVLLLDLTTPRMSGLEALGHIRRSHPSLPVVITSGYAHGEGLPKDELGNWTSFLPKPFGVQELLSALAKAVTA
jgi:signal transduction histidine kinase/ActR/RegA family two-component response regulator